MGTGRRAKYLGWHSVGAGSVGVVPRGSDRTQEAFGETSTTLSVLDLRLFEALRLCLLLACLSGNLYVIQLYCLAAIHHLLFPLTHYPALRYQSCPPIFRSTILFSSSAETPRRLIQPGLFPSFECVGGNCRCCGTRGATSTAATVASSSKHQTNQQHEHVQQEPFPHELWRS